MTTPWKVLVISIVAFQIILTGCFLKMAAYSQWLHFVDTDIGYAGLMDTAPGQAVAYWLIATVVILVVVNAIAIAKHGKSARSAG